MTVLSPSGAAFAVSTTVADELRAAVLVEGVLDTRTCPVLLGILATHVRAGRRYLRVDVRAATITDEVVTRLAECHAAVGTAEGMVAFHGADSGTAPALRGAGLLVAPSD